MAPLSQHIMSRRGFCLCCVTATTAAASGGWLTPRQAFAQARNIVDMIRNEAAKAPIKVHGLRRNVSILEGSGGNIGVLTGADGKVSWQLGQQSRRAERDGAGGGRRRHRHRCERSFELRGVLHAARRVEREGAAVALCIVAGRSRPARSARGLERRWRLLANSLFDPYRPELYYMRGPGPKWRAKHAGGAGCAS